MSVFSKTESKMWSFYYKKQLSLYVDVMQQWTQTISESCLSCLCNLLLYLLYFFKDY